jgi:hypothetical protein
MLIAEKSLTRRKISYPSSHIINQLLAHYSYLVRYRYSYNTYNPYIIELQASDKYDNYQKIKNKMQFNVNLVNIFYAMVGIKRAYYLLSYCGSCDADISNSELIAPYKFTKAHRFIVVPKKHPGSADYFEYPNWYNKIYSRFSKFNYAL